MSREHRTRRTTEKHPDCHGKAKPRAAWIRCRTAGPGAAGPRPRSDAGAPCGIWSMVTIQPRPQLSRVTGHPAAAAVDEEAVTRPPARHDHAP